MDIRQEKREMRAETAQMEAYEMASAIAEAVMAAVDAEYQNERWAKFLDTWNYDQEVIMAPTAVAFAVRRAVYTALSPKALAQTRRELRERDASTQA